MSEKNVRKWLESALVEVEDKPDRQPRFEGDREALDTPLTPPERAGYDRAMAEVRRALLGDGDAVRKACLDILSYRPGFYPEGAKHFDGTTQDPAGEYDPTAWENCPLFSEHYLYNLFGKDEARTILGMLHRLMDAAGVVHWHLSPDLNKVDKRRREHHENSPVRRAARDAGEKVE